MALISIIVPCYNVENLIDRCVLSIVNQTIGIENLEVILVNDASTDFTLEKLKAWEQRYPDNLLVITYQENIKQGGARNIGLQYASSDYIGFVDADDWIEPEMYEELYQRIIVGDCGLVQCKYIDDTGNKALRDKGDGEEFLLRFEPRKGVCWSDVNERETGSHGQLGGLWSILYPRKLIVENHIWFLEKLSYEDNFWMGIIRLYTAKICVIDKILYHYYVNHESTVMQNDARRHLDRVTVEVMLVEEYKKRGVFDIFYREIMFDFILRAYLGTYNILFTRCEQIPDIYSVIRSRIFYYFPDWLEMLRAYFFNMESFQMVKLLMEQENCTVREIKEAYITDRKNGKL